MRERKRTRWKDYDYSQNGFYFITICTKDRIDWFGHIRNEEMVLNDNGRITEFCWHDLPNHYSNARLDDFVIMPNHVHGVLVIDNGIVGVGSGFKPDPTRSHGLSEIVRGFKTFSSRRINETINNGQKFHWQRSFYDHVIRNDSSLQRIRKYIQNNPAKWESDRNNEDLIFP